VTTWTIVLAAGGGNRFGGPKQFAEVGGERAVDRVVRTARSVSDGIVLVLPPGTAWDGAPVEAAVDGGATRAESVRCGLAAVPERAGVVLVHDAAHPLASPALFEAVLVALERSGADAALPVVPLVEALKQVSHDVVSGHPPRTGLVQAQTPHAFRAAALRAAHAGAPEAVEDVELVCAAGGQAVVVAGDPRNLHVTTPEELEVADALATAWRRRG
jgi:2-C-methyl-D-erythritol 4-phosphate cytidylyltransferase